MASRKSTVLLFEDDDKIAARFEKSFAAHAGKDLQLEIFPLSEPSRKGGPFEDRLEDAVKAALYYNSLVLVVTRS